MGTHGGEAGAGGEAAPVTLSPPGRIPATSCRVGGTRWPGAAPGTWHPQTPRGSSGPAGEGALGGGAGNGTWGESEDARKRELAGGGEEARVS